MSHHQLQYIRKHKQPDDKGVKEEISNFPPNSDTKSSTNKQESSYKGDVPLAGIDLSQYLPERKNKTSSPEKERENSPEKNPPVHGEFQHHELSTKSEEFIPPAEPLLTENQEFKEPAQPKGGEKKKGGLLKEGQEWSLVEREKEVLMHYVDQVKAFIHEAEERVLNGFREAKEKLHQLANATTEKYQHTKDSISHAIDATKDKLSDFGENVVHSTKEGFEKSIEGTKGAIHFTYDKAKEGLHDISEKVANSTKQQLENVKQRLHDIGTLSSEEYDAAKEKLSDIKRKTLEIIDLAKEKGVDLSEDLVNKTREIFKDQEKELDEMAEKVRENTQPTQNFYEGEGVLGASGNLKESEEKEEETLKE